MTTKTQILTLYDAQLRLVVPAHSPAGQEFHVDGPLLRVTGQHRGFIETEQTVGLSGLELDRLIIENRNFFASRGKRWSGRLGPTITRRTSLTA